MKKLHRRDFLKLMGGSVAAMGAPAMLMPQQLLASEGAAFGDYKALVCLFMAGGNDSLNMVVPTQLEGGSGYENYAQVRSGLAAKYVDLSAGINPEGSLLSGGAGNPYYMNGNVAEAYTKGLYFMGSDTPKPFGINAMMPELAHLIQTNDASPVANMGTLVTPVTRSQILSGEAELPKFLFAHNHQQNELQFGRSDVTKSYGWAGKLNDNWAGVNGENMLGMNISYAGDKPLLKGASARSLQLSAGRLFDYSAMGNPDSPSQSTRRQMYETLHDLSRRNQFRALYNSMIGHSFDLTDVLKSVEAQAPDFTGVSGPYGEPLFDVPDAGTLGLNTGIGGGLIRQFEAVAKMIHYGQSNGVKRQVFFVQIGGFDTHGNQAVKHPVLLREVSLALYKFQQAMEALDLSSNVTTYTLSDFARTVSSNGDGTDHAWGGHSLIMGGAVDGGKLYGELPDLTLGGPDDYSSKGRIIPKIASDQIQATLAKWFGVDDDLMPVLFPNIDNFSTRDLEFMT